MLSVEFSAMMAPGPGKTHDVHSPMMYIAPQSMYIALSM